MNFFQVALLSSLGEKMDAVACEAVIGVGPGHWCLLFSQSFSKLSEKKNFNILQGEWNFLGAICYQCTP